MKHAVRMFLIPEELFVELNASKAGAISDGSATGLVRRRLGEIESDQNLDSDAKAIQYQQEFKRYNKLLHEAEERPTDVKLQNIEEIAEKIAQHSVPVVPPSAPKTVKRIARPKTLRRTSRKAATKQTTKTLANGNDSDEGSFHSVNDPPLSSLPYEKLKTQALTYIRKNANDFGSDGDKLLKWVRNQWSAIPGSSIEKIVDHILKHGGQRVRPLHVGHEEFMKRLESHPRLREILFSSDAAARQSGRGLGGMKRYKKKTITNLTPFYFKPSLWPRH